jgi:hypothetical protein
MLVAVTPAAVASPNVELDEPVYEELARRYARGELPPYDGGLRPLTEMRVRELRGLPRLPDAFWIAPVSRLVLGTRLVRDSPRSYSTPARPRDLLAGRLAIGCEHDDAWPCETGAALRSSVESSAGYGDRVSATTRITALTGTDEVDAELQIDRAYVSAELLGLALEIGRDVLALGPSRHTQLAWGQHAAPLDQIRIATTRPWRLGSTLHVSGQYVLGRLRAPQRYPGTLASIMRGQIDLGSTAEVGVVQMLQLGGDGAPSLGIVDFLLEHVRRRDISASETDSSNRRFGGDVTIRIAGLDGVRAYYSVMFEDIRRARFIDAVRYDADHLIGFELADIGHEIWHALTVEWHQTGFRSQEHTPRTSGFTNADRVVGAALGPDAKSLLAEARLDFADFSLYPWVQVAGISSDTYELIAYGPINRISDGEDEVRYRFGARARIPVTSRLRVEAEALFERIDDFAFQSGVDRNNGGIIASIIWCPAAPLGTLSSN